MYIDHNVLFSGDYIRGVATGVDIGIYTPPQNKFLATPLDYISALRGC